MNEILKEKCKVLAAYTKERHNFDIVSHDQVNPFKEFMIMVPATGSYYHLHEEATIEDMKTRTDEVFTFFKRYNEISENWVCPVCLSETREESKNIVCCEVCGNIVCRDCELGIMKTNEGYFSCPMCRNIKHPSSGDSTDTTLHEMTKKYERISNAFHKLSAKE